MTINKLDFVVVGAQKCATTWLYDCLNEHREFTLRDSKNEDFYFGGEAFNNSGGIEWYFSQFSKKNPQNKFGCVSVEYIEDSNITSSLFDLNNELKVIFSLRNPFNRLVSAYKWYVRKAFIPDLPLNEGLKLLLDHYNSRVSNDNSEFYKDLIERSFYSYKIARFLKYFPKGQIKVILYDDIQDNPYSIVSNLYNFLGADSSFIPNCITTIPKLNSDIKILNRIQRTFPNSKIVGRLVDTGNQFFQNKSKNPYQEIDNDLVLKYSSIFKKEIETLVEILQTLDPIVGDKVFQNWK